MRFHRENHPGVIYSQKFGTLEEMKMFERLCGDGYFTTGEAAVDSTPGAKSCQDVHVCMKYSRSNCLDESRA